MSNEKRKDLQKKMMFNKNIGRKMTRIKLVIKTQHDKIRNG